MQQETDLKHALKRVASQRLSSSSCANISDSARNLPSVLRDSLRFGPASPLPTRSQNIFGDHERYAQRSSGR